jgi:lipoprotein-anchoring transpeptidase ErfK/SrfK
MKGVMSQSRIRATLAAGAMTLLGGCVTDQARLVAAAVAAPTSTAGPQVAARYAALDDGNFTVPGVDAADLRPAYVRQVVDFPTTEQPGTIVVEPRQRFLYLVMENGKALRYGVGVGREGLAFTGTAEVGRKAEWPHWTPTPDMIKREPKRYAKWADGMDGGTRNPLGARALYLFRGGKDTLYRIHGTNEPETIGHAVSSGCIRMMNQDVIDLYRRVPTKAKIVVR